MDATSNNKKGGEKAASVLTTMDSGGPPTASSSSCIKSIVSMLTSAPSTHFAIVVRIGSKSTIASGARLSQKRRSKKT